jgi:hypothetical protein
VSTDPFCLRCGLELTRTDKGWAAYRRTADLAHLSPIQCAEAPSYGPHLVEVIIAEVEEP